MSSPIVVPDDYATIQSAIEFAPEGATIYVRNGTYNESLTITKALTILGSEEAPTIIRSPINSDVVYVRANNLTFARFRIEGSSESFGSGIYLTQSQNCRILNNTIVNNRYGIYIWDSFNITLKCNEMINSSFNFGVWGLVLNHFLHEVDTSNLVDGKPVYFLINENNKTIPTEAGYVALINSTNIVVKDLNLMHNYQGVVVAYSTSITLQNLTVSRNYYGIHLLVSNKNLIRLDSVELNHVGVLFDLSSNNDISENNFSNNGIGLQFSYSPLLPQRCVENLIHENNITNNEDGIQALGALNNTFYGNKISTNNRYGILSINSFNNIFCGNIFNQNNLGVVLNQGGDNIFFNNNFINNTAHVHIENSNNWWNSTFPIGGNYWSDLFIKDVDMDGLADSPYTINNNNVDEHPLAGIFYNYTIMWRNIEYYITFVCNSSVDFLEFFPYENKISIGFIGPTETSGFSRMSIPKELFETLWGGNLTILIDEYPSPITKKWEDNSYIYIYFVYPHPISHVAIIPEFSSKLLLLFTSLILLRIFIKKNIFPTTRSAYRFRENSNFSY
jgi:parallel beta-helix repeat protein